MKKMSFSKEIVGEWFGVAIPPWIRAFDCRSETFSVKADWGDYLFGSEKAAADLGLLSENHNYYITPIRLHPNVDLREAYEEELHSEISAMVREAFNYRQEFLSALESSNLGGSAYYYLPVAICMSNFGWSLVCDVRVFRVKQF